MTLYKLTNHNSIIRLADNACIPFAEGNTDYAKYLQDIEADPACVLPADPLPVPSYAELRAAAYPPITEYVDGIVKGDDAQIAAYIDACIAVKALYPKLIIGA